MLPLLETPTWVVQRGLAMANRPRPSGTSSRQSGLPSSSHLLSIPIGGLNDGQAHVADQRRLLRRCPGGRCRRAPAAQTARPGRVSDLGPLRRRGQSPRATGRGAQGGALRHRTVRRPCGYGAGVATRGSIAGPGRFPPLGDQLPLVLNGLVQSALRLRHGRRRPR